MYIQGIIFLIRISKHIKLITIKFIINCSKQLLYEAFDNTLCLYNKAGFEISKFHVDQEFQCLETPMTDIDISIVFYTAQVHVPDIEQCIQTVHNCYQTGYHCLLYNAIPKPMVIALAKRCVKFLNMFPPKGGISSYYSP